MPKTKTRKIRKVIIKVLLFLCFSEIAFPQQYVPFPDSNAVWRQNDIWFDGTTYICRDYQLYIVGDTLINSLAYRNIYWSGTYGPNLWCNYQVFSTGEPVTAIREDLSKHIYLYSYYDSTEYLLNDFNLSVGDTLPSALPFNPWQQGEFITISQIDSILIGSSYRKRYWCSTSFSSACSPCPNYMRIIEGIGSDYGLFADLSPSWQEKDFLLLCFKQNGQDVSPVGQQCALVPVGINEYNTNNSKLIYPNPSTGKFSLFLPNVFNKRISLTLFDMLGNLVLTKEFTKTTALLSIDLSDKPKGIYFAKINQGNEFFISKIIIQ